MREDGIVGAQPFREAVMVRTGQGSERPLLGEIDRLCAPDLSRRLDDSTATERMPLDRTPGGRSPFAAMTSRDSAQIRLRIAYAIRKRQSSGVG